MDDPNPLENDPQNYCEDWFNMAILTSKEFQLPNLSPSFINNWLMGSASHTRPSFPLRIPSIQTNLPETDQNVASGTGSKSLSLPNTVVSPNNNIVNYPSSSSDISSSIHTSTQTSIHTTARPQCNGSLPAPCFPFRNTFSFNSSLVTRINLGNPWIGSSHNLISRSITSGHGYTILSTTTTDMNILPNTPEIFSRNSGIFGLDQEIQYPVEVRSYNFNSEGQNHGNNNFLGSPSSSTLPMVKKTLVGAEKRKIDEHECTLDKAEYKCFICDSTFPNGNALGGHMSYHAKKRKLEAMKAGVFKPQTSVRMENENVGEEFGDGSTAS